MGDFHCPKCKPFLEVDCESTCGDPSFECPRCYREYRTAWPHLVGTDGAKAKVIIERENPLVSAIIVPHGSGVVDDWCCNRVWVFLDKNGMVRKPIPYIAN